MCAQRIYHIPQEYVIPNTPQGVYHALMSRTTAVWATLDLFFCELCDRDLVSKRVTIIPTIEVV